MHTVELLEAALAAIKRLGYRVRAEHLDGGKGGLCEFNGRRWLFLDISQAPLEQLHQVLELLRADPKLATLQLAPELNRLVYARRAA
ncbi:MAG: hypothetical protein K8U03_13630 [Planctomycetia bacterium]|nr:hypothetical protein [Planctomycetia bacterium]